MITFDGCRRRLGPLLVVAWTLLAAASGNAQEQESSRGGSVKWARLRIGSAEQWDRHIVGDTFLLDFLRRNTSLDIDGVVYEAHADKLDELCRFPFLFIESLAPATEAERHNIGEYVRRGGFIFIDACEDNSVNSNVDAFLRNQIKILSAEFPGMLASQIPASHPVFSALFKMDAFPPTPRGGSFNPVTGPHIPLSELFLDGRSVGIISLGGLQCARAGHNGPLQGLAGMRMTTNIYVYALLQNAPKLQKPKTP